MSIKVIIKETKDNLKNVDKSAEAWFKNLSKAKQRGLLFVVIFIVFVLFAWNYHVLGLSKLCENSGGVLYDTVFGVKCMNMSEVAVCQIDDKLFNASAVNDFAISWDQGGNLNES